MSAAVHLSIPRWQWRTCAADLSHLFSRLPTQARAAQERVVETQVISPHSSHSVVLCDERLTVTWRQETSPQGFERWDSIIDLTLPFPAAELERLWTACELPRPHVQATFATVGSFLEASIAARMMPFVVTRWRSHTFVEGIPCTFERVEIAPTKQMHSFAIEHEDPALMLTLLADLGLQSTDNINFVHGLKTALGLQAQDTGNHKWQKK
jgi:hypothetical protein